PPAAAWPPAAGAASSAGAAESDPGASVAARAPGPQSSTTRSPTIRRAGTGPAAAALGPATTVAVDARPVDRVRGRNAGVRSALDARLRRLGRQDDGSLGAAHRWIRRRRRLPRPDGWRRLPRRDGWRRSARRGRWWSPRRRWRPPRSLRPGNY